MCTVNEVLQLGPERNAAPRLLCVLERVPDRELIPILRQKQ